MEQYGQAPSNTNQSLFELQIDQQSIAYMSETARWAKFLSIVGFVMCGLMVIFALLFGSIMSSFSRLGGSDVYSSSVNFGSTFFSLFYIVLAILCFFPCLYLFNFSTKMQTALRNNDQANLNLSFGNLKSCFKFVGILTIVILSFYLLGIIVVFSVVSMWR